MEGSGIPTATAKLAPAPAKRNEGNGLRDYGHPLDMQRMRAHRLARVQAELRRRDYGACVLFNPNNIRYATGSRNMQVCALHCPTRYVFLPAEGRAVLFDYFGSEHLAEPLETIGEVRPAIVWDFFSAADRAPQRVEEFAAAIAGLMRSHGGAGKRLALDSCDLEIGEALQRHGLSLFRAQEALELARSVKSQDEILGMSHAMAVCEAGVANMREALKPGITENQLWSILHQTNIALGGEWIETRLLSSGGRTNPWFQESSDRIIRAGDLVAFDTDLVGPFGFGCDMSRTVLCGDAKATDEQKRLYSLAFENVQHNIAQLRPGMTFREYVERSWTLPEEFVPRRYAKIAHGIGLGFEYPYIPYKNDWAEYGYDGVIVPGMTLCIESYIGATDGSEGVKLEEQVVVLDSGVALLSSFPYEERLL